MEAPLRSNGTRTRPGLQIRHAATARSRLAGRVDHALNAALGGDRSAVLNVTVGELLSEPDDVADVIRAAIDRPGAGMMGHWMLHELLRRSELYTELLDSLASPNPLTRAAAARVCGAARMTEAVSWIGDLLDDSNPHVREAAVRGLAQAGGRRAVEHLMAAADTIPTYRLAIALSQAASDVDIEALMRHPASEEAAVATVLACGLRRDALRVVPLVGIAHDRRWPKKVRLAACSALASIGDRSAAAALHRLAASDPDKELRGAAERACRRISKGASGR